MKGINAQHIKPGSYMGGFSACNMAKGGDEWVKDLVDIFEDYGWHWFYHAWQTDSMTFDIWEAKENRMAILSRGWNA